MGDDADERSSPRDDILRRTDKCFVERRFCHLVIATTAAPFTKRFSVGRLTDFREFRVERSGPVRSGRERHPV